MLAAAEKLMTKRGHLAEAASFVMESRESESATDSAAPVSENTQTSDLTGTTTEILSLDPAQPPETKEAAADCTAPSPAEPGGKFKRKKRSADKPVLAM